MPGAGGSPNLGWLKTLSDDIAAVQADVGTLSNLTTTDKTSVVSAVNEVNTRITVKVPVVSVKEAAYGAVGDRTSSSPGTDDTTAINAALTAAQAMADDTANQTKRQKVIFPPGEYRVTGPVTIPPRVDVEMDSARIAYSGTDRSFPILTIHGTAGTYLQQYGRYKGLAVAATASYTTLTLAEQETFVGILVKNCRDSDFDFKGIDGFAHGLRLQGGSTVNNFVGYNSFHGATFYGCKNCVDITAIDPNSLTGWVNENSFYDMNMSFGAAAGFRGALSAIRYNLRGTNNNRFLNCCVQLPAAFTANKLTASMVITQGVRYYNETLLLEYIADSGQGSLSVIPTHTSGSADSFTYVGPYFHSPIYDPLGSSTNNKHEGFRHEGGYGPFFVCGSSPSAPVYPAGITNSFELYRLDAPQGVQYKPSVRFTVSQNTYVPLKQAVHTYGDAPEPSVIIDNLPYRYLASSSSLCLTGFHFVHFFSASSTPIPYVLSTADGNGVQSIRLCDSYILNNSSHNADVLIDAKQGYNRFAITWIFKKSLARTPTNELGLRIFDAALARIQPNTLNDLSALTSALTYDNTYKDWTSGASSELMFAVGNNTNLSYFSAGLRGNSGPRASGLMIRAFSEGDNHYSKLRVFSAFDPAGTEQVRSCYEKPIIGRFPRVGEMIVNKRSTTGQVKYWTVKTAGDLAPNYVGGTTVYPEELRYNGAGKIYAANTTNHAGAACGIGGLTGTTATESDGGTFTWRYVGVQAVLEDADDLYT